MRIDVGDESVWITPVDDRETFLNALGAGAEEYVDYLFDRGADAVVGFFKGTHFALPPFALNDGAVN